VALGGWPASVCFRGSSRQVVEAETLPFLDPVRTSSGNVKQMGGRERRNKLLPLRSDGSANRAVSGIRNALAGASGHKHGDGDVARGSGVGPGRMCGACLIDSMHCL
jgi:hypothetical protein